MNKSMQNAKKRAFSLAEALITLLIVSLITLASIPILTKKTRSTVEAAKHGSFACYWQNGELISRYQIGNVVTTGNTIEDADEAKVARLDFSGGTPELVLETRKGCVFSPPSGAKNFVVTIVGGGGGGAASVSENYSREFYNDKPADEDSTSIPFEAPSTTKYRFLVAGGGGGGGDAWGSCWDGSHYAGKWACGGSGTPGAVIVAQPQLFPKGTKFNITAGGYGKAGGKNVLGGYGGDSIVEVEGSVDGKKYFMFAQGGGGGFSNNYESGLWSYYYDKENYRDAGARHSSIKYLADAEQGTYRMPAASMSVKVSTPAEQSNLLRSATGGGYLVKGFSVTGYNNRQEVYWNEYEKQGAFLYEVIGSKWKKGETAQVGVARTDYTKKRPFRNGAMTKELMDEFNVSRYEDQAHPFAAGGAGGLSKGPLPTEDRHPNAGGKGVIAVKWNRAFGGLGGKAGSVSQTAYSELPQNTLVFPGRGGTGGRYFIYHPKKSVYHLVVQQAMPGESSFIKNGAEVLGGAAAVSVNTNSPSTYHVINNDNTNIGQSGQLSDILPTHKTAGGAGGLTSAAQNTYIDNTNNLNGRTRTDIFKNGKVIGLFNELLAAGAGGGGGAASIDLSGPGQNVQNEEIQKSYVNANLGRGGDGSSGIVFIQW